MSGKSCTTQLLELPDIWSRALEEGDSVDVIYRDFEKAFDIIPHRRVNIGLDTGIF